MKIFKVLFFLIVIISLSNCHSPKKVLTQSDCNKSGVIVDKSGLDGCKWLIVQDDGTKLLPQKWPNSFEPKDKMSVTFSFTEVKDAISICMAEDKVIQLECIHAVAGKPAKPSCSDTVDPMSIPWMQVAMAKNGSTLVEKFHYLDKYAYLFKGVNLDNDLYDCQGNLLCSYREIEQNQCSQQLVNLGRGTIIWRGK